MVRNFRQLLITLILTSGLVAQGVLQITLPETGEAIEGDLVTVSFTLASYFSIGEPECVDCDGYITVFVNENFIQNVTSSNDFNINELYDGNYLLPIKYDISALLRVKFIGPNFIFPICSFIFLSVGPRDLFEYISRIEIYPT